MNPRNLTFLSYILAGKNRPISCKDSSDLFAGSLGGSMGHRMSNPQSVMKKLLTLFTALFCFLALAQTTNRFMTAPNIRQVGGTFYDVNHSQLFSDFSGECVQVLGGGLIIHEYETKTIYRTTSYGGVGTGNFLSGGTVQTPVGQRVVVDRDIYVLNFPTNIQATTGSKQSGRAMRIGVTNINGETIELYDYGRRGIYTVIQTNSPIVAMATNAATANRAAVK